MKPWEGLFICMDPAPSDSAPLHAASVAFSVGISEHADDIILRMRTPPPAMASAAANRSIHNHSSSMDANMDSNKMDSNKKDSNKKDNNKSDSNKPPGVEFPPPGYRPTLVNKLLAVSWKFYFPYLFTLLYLSFILYHWSHILHFSTNNYSYFKMHCHFHKKYS